MARRIPRFALPAEWDAARKRRTLRLAHALDEAVWEMLQKTPFKDWHSYSLEGDEQVLEDLKECFEHIPAKRAHLRSELKIRALITNFGGHPPGRGEEDRITFNGFAGNGRPRVKLYFSPLPEELPEAVHEVYVQLRYDGMDQETARRAALAVLA